MITQVSVKVLVGATIALTAAALTPPTPAGADPSSFGTLSCSCESRAPGEGGGADQVDQGIKNGLAYLNAVPASGNSAPLPPAARDRSSR